MEPNHESEVEKPCGSMSEEDTWWRLFRLLIPEMESWDLAYLKGLYDPCKWVLRTAGRLPRLTITRLRLRSVNDGPELKFLGCVLPRSAT